MVHLYDEGYEATDAPWFTFVPLALSRARTAPVDPKLLSTLLASCKEVT